MPQASVFSLNTSHVSLADNLVARFNKHWIDFPAIGNIKETLPAFDKTPQTLEGGTTAVAYHPGQNSRLVVIDCGPNPQLVTLVPHKGKAVRPAQLPLEFLQILGHRAVDVQPLESSASQLYGGSR
jgi:hypothetical protein